MAWRALPYPWTYISYGKNYQAIDLQNIVIKMYEMYNFGVKKIKI